VFIKFRHSASTALVTVLLAASPCLAAWQNQAPFGAALKGDLFTPTKPGTAPAILVVIHYCTGRSSSVHSWFESAAETNGFYLIAPDAGKNCFDSSISRNANSDPGAIVTMVNYVLANTSADRNRVFAAGMSSGGCMTNTLLAAFPDVFAGGSAMPGFPAGLWPAGDTSCSKCGSSPDSSGDTGQFYANKVTSVFTFNGTRPCVQQWVGGGDEFNFDGWLDVVASQFQILGNLGPKSDGSGGLSGWTRKVYKDTAGNIRLETNLGPASQKHDLGTVGSGLYNAVVSFLGLDKPTGACGLTTSGGASSTGGASSVAGSSSTGGNKATGGTSSAAGSSSTGGNKATGGASSFAAGGTRATGGTSAAGGSKGTGGASSLGSTKAAGGATASGGTVAATGGTAENAGGASSSTLNAGTGGANQTTTAGTQTGGRSAATTDQPGGAGNAGEGGNTATAGSEALGGASVVASTPGSPIDQGGCGCRAAGKTDASLGRWSLALLGAALLLGRRRQSRRVRFGSANR